MRSVRRLALLPGLLAVLALLPVGSAGADPGLPEGAEATPPGEIIGGTRADPHEYPFQVALLHSDVQDRWSAQFCGGTLIAPDTVLTAGHCVTELNGGITPARRIDILAGTNRLMPGGGQRVHARAVRRHPGYLEGAALENDIAVIQLGTQLPYPTVQTAVTGDEALYPADTVATTIGWGDRDIRLNTQYYPLYLREVEVPIVDDGTCGEAYPDELVAEQMVCAGDMVDGGEDSCYGDSGGPLMVPEDDHWLQIGVVSTGRGCARRPYPGIYTEVAHYDDFVTPYTQADTVPDRVTDLHARPLSPSSVRLSWKAPFFDGGTPITQYRIDLPDLGRSHAVVGSQRYFRLRDLPAGIFRVEVRAVNVEGASAVRAITVRNATIID